jgi:ABC-type dipeptide/oligopeptide/nickel transport system permease subunit
MAARVTWPTHLRVAIVIEAAFGFLGVGIPPPTPTWGNMLADSLTSLVPHGEVPKPSPTRR